jgi:hypothetical protein
MPPAENGSVVSAVRHGLAQIEREFEYVDARGFSSTLLVNISMIVSRDYPATRFEPRTPVSTEFVEAHYRNDKGAWVLVRDGEWLDGWVTRTFECLEEADLLEAIGQTDAGAGMRAAISGSDALHFPPALSTRIAAEIEAIAWTRTDLLGDIPEHAPDAADLAAIYADVAADVWADDNDCPPNQLPHRIIDTTRNALIPRIEAEIDRREEIVRAEYQRRVRAGRIDVNGVGDVPSYYGLEDMKNPASIAGRESEPSGWMSPEVLIMANIDKWDPNDFWHFECPECGFGSAELGPADAHTFLCEVCLDEDGRAVRLRRWPVELSLIPAA